MFTKAESYVPAIVYANAGSAISKHAAVVLDPGGLVYLATGSAEDNFLGIAMEAANAGEHVLVQTDGIRYGWEGSPTTLLPGAVYFTALDGSLTDSAAGTGVRVGMATDPTTLVFSPGGTTVINEGGEGGGGGSVIGGSTNLVYEFLRVVKAPLTIESRLSTTWIPLKTPVANPKDIVEIRLIGCGTLIPGVDYIITTTPPVAGAGIAMPSTAMPIGDNSLGIKFTAINFDPALLMFTAPEGEFSIMPRMRLGDRLMVVRREMEV